MPLRPAGAWLAAALIAAACVPAAAAAQTIAVPQAASPAPVPLVPTAPALAPDIPPASGPLAAPPAPAVAAPAAPPPPAPAAASPPAPAAAAEPPAAPVIDEAEQVRGLSCVTGGLLAAGGTWAFTELVAAAAVGASGLAVTVPLAAAAFVTGCSIGSMSLPALYALLIAPR